MEGATAVHRSATVVGVHPLLWWRQHQAAHGCEGQVYPGQPISSFVCGKQLVWLNGDEHVHMYRQGHQPLAEVLEAFLLGVC